jgi:hypothetical protein
MKRIGCIFALSLCLVSPGLAAPKLGGYATDIYQTSVSGVSSGGAMAVQMHVAHSSIMRGVGVIAGVTYDCANSALPSASLSLAQGGLCMDGSTDYTNDSINRTDGAAGNGFIDSPNNLAGQKVWLFSGYNDGLVRRGAMDAVAKYYGHYVNPGNVFYQTDNHAPHALVTNDNFGGPCLGYNHNWVNNCDYDAAGLLLKHIYGNLISPSGTLSSSPQPFDQTEFVETSLVGQVGLADTGWVYVPSACNTDTCRVHVVFHGCLQYAGTVSDAVYNHGGYNKWADKNKIIVLYPQTEPVAITPLLSSKGCWDWWGLKDTLLGNRAFARKTGHQISAIRKMIDRLAEGPAHSGGSSDTFGIPQNFLVADSTSTSIALIWQPNSAAQGFNIYRSRSSTGTYTKMNTDPVLGASFGDQGLTPKTTYYYKISAIKASNQESAKTGPAHMKTAAKPAGCNPYFSDNNVHVEMLRAFPSIDGKGQVVARAVGGLEVMGAIDEDHFSELIKDDVLWPSYHARYCP